MSEPATSTETLRSPVQLFRLAVDKPQAAVDFLHTRSQGVMDLIAHFWERLSQTPPLHRNDLHLIVAAPIEYINLHINTTTIDSSRLTGAMLYVPKAHRADVMTTDAPSAAAFCAYITHRGPAAVKGDAERSGASPKDAAIGGEGPLESALSIVDLSTATRGAAPSVDIPGSPAAGERVPIDFLTGYADTIAWMVPMLLPIVHRKAPARQLVNVVMQLPDSIACASDVNVRIARDADVPVLNRWRKQYREERGILFSADLDAWVDTGRVFVYEHDKQVVAVAKFDLELQRLIEIGGVYTFPEFRNQGFGAKIVSDLACRVRALGKLPTLQVDQENVAAMNLYAGAGWVTMGKLSRVWLTG